MVAIANVCWMLIEYCANLKPFSPLSFLCFPSFLVVIVQVNQLTGQQLSFFHVRRSKFDNRRSVLNVRQQQPYASNSTSRIDLKSLLEAIRSSSRINVLMIVIQFAQNLNLKQEQHQKVRRRRRLELAASSKLALLLSFEI